MTAMENWKRALVGTSAGAAVLMLAKGKTTAGVILAGVSLSILASEYPDRFAELRDRLPEYMERGSVFLDLVLRAGARLAEVEARGARWHDARLGP
ncbi:MAG TPA: hypothetical protein VEI99_07350 [Terriglobales bacterium]|nr:hypothetical protein [Terriglobales bacterium]